MRVMKWWAVVVLLVVGAACASETEPLAPESANPTPAQATGVITTVEPSEGSPVQFTVEEEDGDVYDIQIDPEVDYGFDLNHLREHQETGDPVNVLIHVEDERLFAVSIADVE